jgi:proteic killer suppression protein
MDITYRNKKIEKECTDANVSDKIYGKEMSARLQMRIDQIRAADSVEEMVKFHIGRCHKLSGKRRGEYAVDLVHPYRLVFVKHGDVIQIAHIIEIVDYH